MKKCKPSRHRLNLQANLKQLRFWFKHPQRVFNNALSSIRFSLTFRIALHYALQLLRTSFAILLVFGFIFAASQAPGMIRTMDRIRQMEPEEGLQYSSAQIGNIDVSAQLLPYALNYDANTLWQFVHEALDDDLFNLPPVLDLCTAKGNQTLMVSFDLSGRLEILLILWGGLLFLDLCRIIVFIHRRHQLNNAVLKPIQDMAQVAATLGAGNLSNRLNVAGTKNELRDLAVVINHMLDRIELSYNSQKQFVSDASHELRTPIAVIQGYVRMLERWGKDDRSILDEGIRAISQETSAMKELVESLLFLARHDKKTLMLEMESFDPCEIMSAVNQEAAMVFPHHTFVLDPIEHTHITADKNMVKQVMRILTDNAAKYTPQGGTITLSVHKQPTGCTLAVQDTGPGIPAEELGKIFNRFYRSDSARKGDASGHGLGLSIARIIVIAHGGTMKVRSKVGKGTTFYVDLPAEPQQKTG